MTMHSRLETLQRLVTLYTAVEEMHSVELKRTTAAVRETEQALCAQQMVASEARISGREALATEDSLGWLMAETQQETSAWRCRLLEKVRQQREELHGAATEQYVASRLKREQMKRVLEDMASREEVEEGRRLQGISDDRYLARRRWSDMLARGVAEEQMKNS